MAGLAERRGAHDDSFWTWRETMYELASRMSPECLNAVAAQCYADMLKAGYTAVCEFHYLHNQPDGAAYAERGAMCQAVLDAATTDKALGVEVPPERRALVGYGSLADVLDVLEATIADREYLVSDRFSAADVYVGSHLGWGMRFGMVEKRPTFERYFERLIARPAAIRAREIDEALMAEKTPPTPA